MSQLKILTEEEAIHPSAFEVTFLFLVLCCHRGANLNCSDAVSLQRSISMPLILLIEVQGIFTEYRLNRMLIHALHGQMLLKQAMRRT